MPAPEPAVPDSDSMPAYPVTAQSPHASSPTGVGIAHGVDEYRFGRFTLYPARKLLVAGDTPVVLGGRAFDLLVALVARAGEVVSHHALVAAVWPHAVVEDNGLRVHMSALRKALGEAPDEQYILTVLGRGYRFIKPVAIESTPRAGPRMGRLIGRDAALADLASLLARSRVVTVTGAGGSGKSALALAHVAARAPSCADGCHVIDFAAVGDAAQMAAALGILSHEGDPVAAICHRQALLVFDNCEHVLAATARLVDRIAHAAPHVTVLVTSRAPLNIAQEAVLRLPPLALPGSEPVTDCARALELSAIALFVERAEANSNRFALTPANLPLVVQLCRQLDGLPLALELAAARVEALGVEGLVARLDEMFRLLTRSRRLAGPRHASLGAMLDWSVGRLDEIERLVLLRLSVFQSAFSLESAVLVCATDDVAPADVVRAVPALAARSLLAVDDDPVIRYRCLHTTRRYAQLLLTN